MVLAKLGIHVQKREIGPLFNTIRKIQLKMDYKDLNVRPETVKVLEENIGKTVHDIGLEN